ncbi:MAG: ethanolamine ammonia-lyase reactivating factor EutA [Deltaproteobacteria bacterium]|nr:ethanolamine ammonia-lyase reactivating factor EutA [Deltaproteobacteria bacterium]
MHDIPHDHDHEEPLPEDEEDHPLWKLDTITLTSVGIDVGTATSQIIFSRLVMRRLGRELSSRFVVTERKTLYLSPIHFTPYAANRERIDEQALGRLIDAAYDAAGLIPEKVDTGAIILTGEAIRRDNARAIAELFSAQRGNFVCATAGHNFEAMLSAHGSGAVALSGESRCRVLNIDIGGGTTKLAACEQGRVLSTAALHIGGRLLVTDNAGVITVLEPGGRELARRAGFEWLVGDRVTPAQLQRLADYMSRAILDLAQHERSAPEFDQLWLTPALNGARNYDAVVFSGGVGEYVYGKEPNSFGDIGAPLGLAIQRQIAGDGLYWPLAPARECIRATVMGAAQHTVQVSGNTIYRANDGLLPQKNLQVLRPDVDLSHDIDANGIAQSIAGHFQAFDLIEGRSEVALVFRWSGQPSAVRIAAFCRGLLQGLPGTLKSGRPIYLVFDHDLAGLVGTILKNDFEIKNDILAIDGVTLSDFDFIDLGKILEPSGTVPVTIKSLVFQF